MNDLRQRVPGHSLIEQLLREWDLGHIQAIASSSDRVVIHEEAMGWYLGVHGERWVATRLALLGPEYTVLHSVPVGRGDSDIDHVVIGPTGVFTLNTKYSPGRKVWSAGFGVYVGDREEKHFIRNLELEARRASSKLTRAAGIAVQAKGLLVFVDPSSMNRKAPAGDGRIDLRVISDAELISTIDGDVVFTEDEVTRLADAAVRADTWHESPSESTIGAHIEQEFVALEEAVGPLVPIRVTGSPNAPAPARDVRHASPRYSKPAPVTAKPRRRGRARKKTSPVEAVVVSFALLGLAYFLTRPEGQAFIISVFAR